MFFRGFISFILIVAFLIAFIGVQTLAIESGENLGNSAILAIELEQNNKTRTILEENTDFIIEETLRGQIISDNLEPELVKFAVSKKLAGFFEKIESEFNEGQKISFFSAMLSPSQYNAVSLAEKKKLIEKDLLENSQVLIIPLGEHSVFAEYSFTGGLMKNNIAGAEISSGNSKQFFLIPIGYTSRIVVVK